VHRRHSPTNAHGRPQVNTETIDVYVASAVATPRFLTVTNHGLDPNRAEKEGVVSYLLELTSSVTDPAARYEDVTVSVGDGVQTCSYAYPFPVYVLYNAYHPDDEAYCADALLRTGYLEAERTIYFQGEASAVRPLRAAGIAGLRVEEQCCTRVSIEGVGVPIGGGPVTEG
jgi:hypothetical protein